MCPSAVVILLVRAQHMTQMPLAEHDHMVEALAADGADQSFSVTVLPRRSWRCRSVANAHRANAPRKCLAVDTVAITNEVIRHRLPPAHHFLNVNLISITARKRDAFSSLA